ncbi:unnamed protein product [Orchesella dallaii]|uniref:Potassium channel domain-containing protein n=1 Tax=Orchesella dallaii TaxID=48710 RepID=A0ABP1S6P9_9HEXA
MSSRKGRPVRPSMRNRPHRSRSWEDPERMMEIETGRHTKLKNCCRSVATFMCTQVGVGGIIVGYAIVGAFGFMALETQDDSVADTVLKSVELARVRTADQLYSDYTEYQFNETEWIMKANVSLYAFQDEGGGTGQGSSSYRSRSGDEEDDDETIIVPSSASIYVLFSYICVGTIMFAEWEGWEYLDSVYFCVTSLCKIGLGDFVPGELQRIWQSPFIACIFCGVPFVDLFL